MLKHSSYPAAIPTPKIKTHNVNYLPRLINYLEPLGRVILLSGFFCIAKYDNLITMDLIFLHSLV